MKILSAYELVQVSGGRQATKNEVFNSMEHYSLSWTLGAAVGLGVAVYDAEFRGNN